MATREAGMSAKRREGLEDQFRDLEEPAPLLDESFCSLGWALGKCGAPEGRHQRAVWAASWGVGAWPGAGSLCLYPRPQPVPTPIARASQALSFKGSAKNVRVLAVTYRKGGPLTSEGRSIRRDFLGERGCTCWRLPSE